MQRMWNYLRTICEEHSNAASLGLAGVRADDEQKNVDTYHGYCFFPSFPVSFEVMRRQTFAFSTLLLEMSVTKRGPF